MYLLRTLLSYINHLLGKKNIQDIHLKDQGEILQILQQCQKDGVITSDVLSILEGTCSLSEMSVRDVCLPRVCIRVIDINDSLESLLPMILKNKHSRFPVVDGNLDHVLGVFLVKDLLHMFADQDFILSAYVRPVLFVPETKPLHHVLRDFRLSRNHMAMVLDEYGGIVGLLTIEDVLECIVGEIDDEFDLVGDEGVELIVPLSSQKSWRVRAAVSITRFNEQIGTNFSDEDHHTIAGLINQHAGRLLRRGEFIDISSHRFHILHADSRRLYILEVEKLDIV